MTTEEKILRELKLGNAARGAGGCIANWGFGLIVFVLALLLIYQDLGGKLQW